MRIAVIGGGPGGLYFAALMKQLDARHEVTVWERNAADDTFGFGVVFSDETLGGIENADTAIFEEMSAQFARWTDIDVIFNGQSHTVGGQGFAAMSRKELLALLQQIGNAGGGWVLQTVLARPVMADRHAIVAQHRGEVEGLRMRAADRLEARLLREQERTGHLLGHLRAVSPQHTLARGYAVVRHRDGRIVRDRAEVEVDELLRVTVAHGDFGARALGTTPADTLPG